MELNMSKLEECFKNAIVLDKKYVAVKVEMQGFEKPELIVNQTENFQTKLDYYKKAYNEDLTLKSFNGIKIVGFAYGDDLDYLERIFFKD